MVVVLSVVVDGFCSVSAVFVFVSLLESGVGIDGLVSVVSTVFLFPNPNFFVTLSNTLPVIPLSVVLLPNAPIILFITALPPKEIANDNGEETSPPKSVILPPRTPPVVAVINLANLAALLSPLINLFPNHAKAPCPTTEPTRSPTNPAI